VSQDTIEMKDYKETLSEFDKDYYKNLVQEKVERYNEIGHVCRVSLRWRGKYYHLQLFFPGSKFPSRKEVENQVHKIYPDATVMVHYASESQPNQPLIRVSENTEERNPNTGLPDIKKEIKSESKNKGNIDDPDLRRLIPESGVLDERLGGKGYKPYTSMSGEKVSGDWEDSDRGAGNRAKKRAGGKVEKKSPTYLAHVHNKEEVEPVNEGEYHAKAAMYQSGMTDASRVKGPVGKAVDKVKNVFKKKEKGGEYRAKAAMYMSGYVPEGEMIEGIMQMIKRVGKKPEPKKHDYGRDAGNIARKKLEKKERETYVNDMSNSFGEESKYYKGNPKGTPKKPKAGDRRPGVKEEKNYVEFMKRVEKLPEVTRDSIKALGDDPLVAKAALEISGLPK
tara:strand:- start:1396 stop:2574 length:1179 start_codon:yes stop_codon:yes gene_type:complete